MVKPTNSSVKKKSGQAPVERHGAARNQGPFNYARDDRLVPSFVGSTLHSRRLNFSLWVHIGASAATAKCSFTCPAQLSGQGCLFAPAQSAKLPDYCTVQKGPEFQVNPDPRLCPRYLANSVRRPTTCLASLPASFQHFSPSSHRPLAPTPS